MRIGTVVAAVKHNILLMRHEAATALPMLTHVRAGHRQCSDCFMSHEKNGIICPACQRDTGKYTALGPNIIAARGLHHAARGPGGLLLVAHEKKTSKGVRNDEQKLLL